MSIVSRSRSVAAWTVALAVAVLFACSDRQSAPTGPATSGADRTPDAGQEVSAAIAAQATHTREMLSRKGILGTAVGHTEDGRPAVVVYLLEAGAGNVPETLDGVPVKRVVTGRIMARSDPTTRARPAPPGFSVGHPDITAGTLGARVTDGTSVYVLSNNHVLANSNSAQIGDSALQPGPADGGTDPADRIGELADYEPIDFQADNVMDAAIASTTTSAVGTATPTDDGYGQPSSTTVSASVGLPVQKYGRTTGLTSGEVSETNVTVTVCYVAFGPFCLQSATFVDQIAITPGTFSSGGDSGSLIVTDDSGRNPVGLLFAGSSTRTIANPIDPILDRFGVQIDDG